MRNATLDYLKLLFAFMVVGIHTDAFINIDKYLNHITVQGIFRIAVPCFFIISGYYLTSMIEKNDSLSDWYKRNLILYAVWMAIYSIFWLRGLEEPYGIAVTIKLLIGHFHLWYLISLVMGVYFIRAVKPNLYLILILYSIGVLIQYTSNYFLPSSENLNSILNEYWLHRNFIFLAVPFLVIGIYLKNKNSLTEISNKKLFLIFFISIALLLTESITNYEINKNSQSFDNYLTLILASTSLVLLAIKNKIPFNTKYIATLSTSIFLIHPFLISIIKKINYFNEVDLTLVTIVSSIIASMILIEINKKIRILL